VTARRGPRLVGVAPRCYTCAVPTTQPRYTVTDTGDLRRMLDLAQRRWPHVRDRRKLLLLLAAAGEEAISREVLGEERDRRRDRQHAAMSRATEVIDVDALLADAAWQ
jgi:hypothetical protein